MISNAGFTAKIDTGKKQHTQESEGNVYLLKCSESVHVISDTIYEEVSRGYNGWFFREV